MVDEDLDKKFEDELTTMEILTKQLKIQVDKLIMAVVVFGFAFFVMILLLVIKVFLW